MTKQNRMRGVFIVVAVLVVAVYADEEASDRMADDYQDVLRDLNESLDQALAMPIKNKQMELAAHGDAEEDEEVLGDEGEESLDELAKLGYSHAQVTRFQSSLKQFVARKGGRADMKLLLTKLVHVVKQTSSCKTSKAAAKDHTARKLFVAKRALRQCKAAPRPRGTRVKARPKYTQWKKKMPVVTQNTWDAYSECMVENNFPKGTTHKQAMAKVQAQLGCPKEHPITRIQLDYNMKKDATNTIKSIVSMGSLLAKYLKLGKRTFPTLGCCQSTGGVHAMVQGRGWTHDMVAKCCAKKDDALGLARCNPKKPSTCMPLQKITWKKEKQRSGPELTVFKMKPNKLKCGPRQPGSGANLGRPPREMLKEDGTYLEDDVVIGEDVEWGRRRKSSRRRWNPVKKLKARAKKAYKKAKKFAKKIKNKVKKGIGGFLMKRIVPKVIKLILKLVPKKYRAIAARMAPLLIKGNIKGAVATGMPLLVKIILPKIHRKYRPLFNLVFPYIARVKPDIKGAVSAFLPRVRGLVMVKALRKVATPMIFLDCAIKFFMIPLVDMDYSIEIGNAHDARWAKLAIAAAKAKKPGCTGKKGHMDSRRGDMEGKNIDAGPMEIKIERKIRATNKVVCSYTFIGDSFRCKHNSHNCCEKWAWNTPRFSTSDFKPELQTLGHDCKAWFMGVNAVVSSTYAAIVSLWHMTSLGGGGCFDDKSSCKSTDFCGKKACQKAPSTSKCQWNPTGKRWLPDKFEKASAAFDKTDATTRTGTCVRRRL